MSNRKKINSGTILCFLVIFILSSCTQQQNWPQFRGPDANMLSSVKNLPEVWDTVSNVAWTYKLDGAGWSSPIVWGDKVFITSSFPEKVAPVPERNPMQGPPPPPRPAGAQQGITPQGGQQPQQGPRPGGNRPEGPDPERIDTTFKQEIYRWELTCIDLNTGIELWKQVAYYGSPKASKQPMNTYASETPVTDGERVYAYFGMTGLFCYDMDGKQLWKKDLGAYQTQSGWGTGSSPVIYNGIIYIQVDNEVNSFIVAIDAATGEEKWKTARDEKTNYSTPYIWKNKLRTELVTCGKTARSYDPETGKLLWELKIGGEQTIPSPVGDDNNIYLGNASGQNAKGNLFSIKAGAEGDITLKEGEISGSFISWIFPDPGLGNASPLLYNGHIYIISSRGGEIKCIKAADGTIVYKDRVAGLGAIWASPWVYNNRVWFFDEKGITKSFNAGDKFELVSDNRLNDKTWASVAITSKGYIFKGVKALYCVR